MYIEAMEEIRADITQLSLLEVVRTEKYIITHRKHKDDDPIKNF